MYKTAIVKIKFLQHFFLTYIIVNFNKVEPKQKILKNED